MDFLSSFREALKHGIAKEEFMKIWYQEMEVKKAVAQSTARADGSSYLGGKFFETLQSQGSTQPSTADLSEMILQLRNELVELSQLQHLEIVTHLQNIDSKLSVLLQEKDINADKTQMYDDHFELKNASGSSLLNSQLLYLPMDQNPKIEPVSSPKGDSISTYSESSADAGMSKLYLKEDGAVLRVKKVNDLIASGNKVSSTVLIPRDCPCKVQLKVWFSKSGQMEAQLSLFGLYNQSLPKCRRFNFFGSVLNKNSGSYSPLFEGTSVLMRHLRPDKEMTTYPAEFCLKTGSGSYEDVTFKELETRGFVHQMNTVIVKWRVTTEEVDMSKANSHAGSKADLLNI